MVNMNIKNKLTNARISLSIWMKKLVFQHSNIEIAFINNAKAFNTTIILDNINPRTALVLIELSNCMNIKNIITGIIAIIL